MILDEADVMLKLGFKEDIEHILGKVREVNSKDLQILLFSATVPAWVRDIAQQHMRPNFRVVDLCQDLTNKTARNVRHLAIDCPWHQRIDALSRVCKFFFTFIVFSKLLRRYRQNNCFQLDQSRCKLTFAFVRNNSGCRSDAW
jgi:superfamily II DNA/RNA helicase